MNISPQEIPAGIDYQLINIAVAGDKSFNQLAEMEKNGWRRVPVTRHPTIRSADPVWIEQGGQALVERPVLLTARAKVWEQNKADAQLLNAASELSYVGQINGRPINTKATAKRRTSVREFFVFHIWRLRVWTRNKIADWRRK